MPKDGHLDTWWLLGPQVAECPDILVQVADPWVALGDFLVSATVVPAVVILLLPFTGLYTPSWLDAFYAGGQPLQAAFVVLGGQLATSWIFAAVATGAYADKAVDSSNLANTLRGTWLAGAVATALLVVIAAVSLLTDCVTGGCTDVMGDISASLVDVIVAAQPAADWSRAGGR
ncbi:unnamed protein product [Prorocentrum cordatum]|uniref:H(+)-exporting diphosphatase n=1 Tax=Prorocentrum cordatum TaxID=2364126 RepID=A0ABN9UIC8_9DINO|nr:unnamed protein product [Polarella glacialis]